MNNKEQSRQEALKAFALEDEALEGVAGGGSKWSPNTKKTTIGSSETDATE